MRMMIPVLSLVVAAGSLVTGPGYGQQPQVTEVKGTATVSGPAAKPAQATAGGRRVTVTKGDLRVEEIKISSGKIALRDGTIDPDSQAVKDALRQAIESLSASLDVPAADSKRLDAEAKGGRGASTVAMKARGRSTAPGLAFEYVGSGKAPVTVIEPGERGKGATGQPPGRGRGRQLAFQQGRSEWQGTISSVKTSVKELRPINGAKITLNSTTDIQQVDLAGPARGRVEFVARIEK